MAITTVESLRELIRNSLFHGRDERVSLCSVDLTTELLDTMLAGFAAGPAV